MISARNETGKRSIQPAISGLVFLDLHFPRAIHLREVFSPPVASQPCKRSASMDECSWVGNRVRPTEEETQVRGSTGTPEPPNGYFCPWEGSKMVANRQE